MTLELYCRLGAGPRDEGQSYDFHKCTLMTFKHPFDQSNQSFDLHYELQNGYDWSTVSLLLLTQRSGSMRQTSSYYHATLQPYRRPEAICSGRQHHACEAAYPRCIRASNPSPRIGRAGGADGCTPTTPHHHQPPREKLTLCSDVLLFVSCSCAGSSSVIE